MIRFRGTILFAIVVVAVGFFALNEYKKTSSESEDGASPSGKERLIKNPVIDSVVTFSVEYNKDVSPKSLIPENLQNYSLKFENDEWKMTTPVNDLGDESTIRSVLHGLADQMIEPVDIDEKNINWEKYGLVKPETLFSLVYSNGETQKISIGSVRSYDQGYYLRRNTENKLFLVDKSFEPNIKHPPVSFRLKKINLPGGDLVKARFISTISTQTWDFTLIKKDGVWSSQKSPELKLDQNLIGTTLASLKFVEGTDILSDSRSPSDLKKHQLDRNTLKLQLVYNKGEKEILMDIIFSYPKTGDAAFLAFLNSAIYKLPKNKVDEYLKDFNAFRDKGYPFQFTESEIKSVTISKSHNLSVQEFRDENQKWIVLDDSKKIVIQDDLNSLIAGLKGLKVDRYRQENKSLAKLNPEHFVSLKNAQGKEIFVLSFGSTIKEKNKPDRYLATSNLSAEIFEIEKSKLDNLISKAFIELTKPKDNTSPVAKDILTPTPKAEKNTK